MVGRGCVFLGVIQFQKGGGTRVLRGQVGAKWEFFSRACAHVSAQCPDEDYILLFISPYKIRVTRATGKKLLECGQKRYLTVGRFCGIIEEKGADL